MGQLPLAQREARLAMKWVRHRCHGASAKIWEMAAKMAPWASEITSSTPPSQRATSARRDVVQAAVSSVVAMSSDDVAPALDAHGGGDHGRDVHHPAPFANSLRQRVDPPIARRPLVQGALLRAR